jgi:hypothetical protein
MRLGWPTINGWEEYGNIYPSARSGIHLTHSVGDRGLCAGPEVPDTQTSSSRNMRDVHAHALVQD